MKKTLALVLALAMVFSMITVAFAEGTLGEDAQICADLGMLKGETGTVDAAYVATAPTRLQAAVMFLRLKGLEAEALAFTGEANFADGNLAWAEGANLLAYLKANPQLGWQGDGTNFNPNNPITAKEYYKVLLEALGYKQNTAEVVGDFTWDNVLEFAAEKGLAKVAAVENYTVNDLAVATVEALKLNVKGGDVSLAATLVEAGKIDAAKAEAAGLYTAAATTSDADLKAVKAIGNTAVEAEFTAEVEKAYAENADNYTIVAKGTTTALEVKAAVLDGTKKVVLETAAQTSGKAYTLTVGGVSINFGGLGKISGSPELDKAEGKDTERVKLTFTKIMDLDTALDAANYTIVPSSGSGTVTVEKAEWDDSSRKIVKLTTNGMVANRTYKVTVKNVKSVDLVVLKSASKSFMAKSDKSAPVPSITKNKCTNTRIIVQFDEEVDKASAEDLANYSLKTGSTALEITSAKLVADADDDMTIVELTTDSQKSGTKYTLAINNIADIKVLANKMTKEKKLDYFGVKVDEGKPTVAGIEYLTNTLVEVRFNETSRLDKATALDLANYSVNNDIAIEKIVMADEDDADCKDVRLTVSELGDKNSYTFTIKNVADEYGNVMKDKSLAKAFVKGTVNTPATVSQVWNTDETTIKVKFTKEVEAMTAKDVANYSINKDIGTPIKAKLEDDRKTVTLTTAVLTKNTEYKLTVNGVKDLADNVINKTVKVVASAVENDIEAPEIDSIEAVNSRVIRVTFNEAMKPVATVGPTLTTIDIDTNGDGTGDITAAYTVTADDDDMVLEFLLPVGQKFTNDNEVTLVDTNAKDIAGNVCKVDENGFSFSANGETPEGPELNSIEQVSVKKFKFQYSEKIDPAVNGTTISTVTGTPATPVPNVPYQLTITVDKDDETIVYFASTQKMATAKEFKVVLNSVLANKHGFGVQENDETYTYFVTDYEDEDAPYIEEVKAENRTKIIVTFNEDMQSGGSFKIKYVDADGKDKVIPTTSITVSTPGEGSLDDNQVSLTFTGGYKLEARYSYTLVVVSRAKDIAGNQIVADAEYDFAGSDEIAVGNYITGVKVLNGTKLELVTYEGLTPSAVVFDVVYGTNDANVLNVSVTAGTLSSGKTKVYTLDADDDGGTPAYPIYAFAKGTTYKVRIEDAADPTKILYTYLVKGVVETGASMEKILPNYQITFTDAEAGDIIQLVNETTGATEQATIGADGTATIAVSDPVFTGALGKITIISIRGDVVLYYDYLYDLP